MPLRGEAYQALIGEYRQTIQTLHDTLRATVRAQGEMRTAANEIAKLEASELVDVEGRNEQERKARLTLALQDRSEYLEWQERERVARVDLDEAEVSVSVAREWCRFYRAVLAFHVANPDDDV